MTTDDGEFFLPTPRVFYRRAPLVQVIGQFHFPPILQIGSEQPVAFQERIRQMFPLLEQRIAIQMPPLSALGEKSARGGSPFPQGSQAYQFHTEDRTSTIEITTKSISFSTRRYTEWRHFRKQMMFAVSAFVEVYRPGFYVRIGLRYQDLILRSKIGLPGVSWSRLLRPEVLGELSNPVFESYLLGAFRVLNMKMPNGAGTVVLQHGLATEVGGTEVGYTIDLDFSSDEKTGLDNASEILERLHARVGHAFRWFITDELHRALDPIAFQDDDDDAFPADDFAVTADR